LVLEDIPKPSFNWIGYDNRDNIDQYRTINFDSNDNVSRINEKGHGDSNSKPYIGLAGIYDWKLFWNRLKQGGIDGILKGESLGISGFFDRNLKAIKYTWFDTGVQVELEATIKRFHADNSPNILSKEHEAIWFLNEKVIKFSTDRSFIRERVERSKLLKNFVPEIVMQTEHMYSYKYVQGDVFSKYFNKDLFDKLLKHLDIFWVRSSLNSQKMIDFKKDCLSFYKEKTINRVNLFFKNYSVTDHETIVNGKKLPELMVMLNQIDWDTLSDGIPGQFHGDCHFENIVYNEIDEKFTFLDWRQNFAENIEVGDIYYDLAKLYHGLIVNHEMISSENYDAKINDIVIDFDFHMKYSMIEYIKLFEQYLSKKGFDVKRVRILTALIFLNIAPLHHHPYSILLFGLGKQMLYENVIKKENFYEEYLG
jgi:hypothetical protein